MNGTLLPDLYVSRSSWTQFFVAVRFLLKLIKTAQNVDTWCTALLPTSRAASTGCRIEMICSDA